MYKNLTIFTIESPITNLDLSNHVFTPCTVQQELSSGFILVNGELVYRDANGNLHVALKTETKRVPADVKKDLIKKRVDSLPFHPTKEEMIAIKNNIHFELLAKVFPTNKVIQAYITDEMIVVNTSSQKQAEELISMLRLALGELICKPYVIYDVTMKMTDWVDTGELLPEDLIIGDSSVLSGLESTIKYKHHDLSCDEIKSHIAEGMVVSELGLLHDYIKFTLTENSQFKGLKFDYESDGFDADCLLLADIVDKLVAITV